MIGDGLVENYLPPERLGAVEAMLVKGASSLVAPIYSAAEVDAELSLRLCAVPVEHCIRNITRHFPDGPTYFAISHSTSVNAVIGRFADYQCVVVAQGVHVRATTLLASLLAHEPLREFLRSGREPQEPAFEPTRSRGEALARLYEDDGNISDEVRSLTASCAYLLLYLLTAHEIGHLALGHLSKSHSGAMDEVSEAVESQAESRAQEWDADGFAFAGTLYLIGSEFREQPVWRDLLLDAPTNLRVLSFAAYVLFTMMDGAGPQDRDPERRTHPRPLVRVGLATLTLMAVMDRFGSVTAEDVLATSRAAVRACEIALHNLGGGVMEPQLADRLGEELEGEIDRLTPILGELWPLLDRSRLDGLFWARGLKARPTLAPAPETSEIGSDG